MKWKMTGVLAGLILILLPGCGEKQRTYASFDEYPARTDDLTEMVCSPDGTRFCLWAPTAEDVRVMLYDSGDEGNAFKIIKLEPGENGTWKGAQAGDLKGKFYTFNVKIKGRWLGDTPGIMAKAVGVNGRRAAIVRMEETDPEGWEKDAVPAWRSGEAVILYQLHVQAFSADTASGIVHRGNYLALTEAGTHNSIGLSTGLDHLKELGVTHVQLMPCFDFAGVDEASARRAPFSPGFSPLNYNVPEGSYATDAHRPEVRIREFKQMVRALHQAGIRVVMDVAYSYTSGAPGSSFERTVPGYFYRNRPEKQLPGTPDDSNVTAVGRPMVRKFMVESLRYWMREYHIDGFCFDRMGSLDVHTMNELFRVLREENPSVVLYGREGMYGCPDSGPDSTAIVNQLGRIPGIAICQEKLAEALLGKERAGGKFLRGQPGGEKMLKPLIAGVREQSQPKSAAGSNPGKPAWQPLQIINSLGTGQEKRPAARLDAGLAFEERVALYKLAQTILFTSQGIPLICAGDEWMMSNGIPKPGSLCPVDWNGKNDQKEVLENCKGLISLKKNHPAFRMADTGEIDRCLEFLPVEGSGVIAYRLSEHAGGDTWKEVIVVLNGNKASATVKVPEGTYTVVCRNGTIALSGMGQLSGGLLTVSGQSALIIYK